jgi:hypothetical protein
MGAFANEPWVAPSHPELYLRLQLGEVYLLDDLHFAIQTSFFGAIEGRVSLKSQQP